MIKRVFLGAGFLSVALGIVVAISYAMGHFVQWLATEKSLIKHDMFFAVPVGWLFLVGGIGMLYGLYVTSLNIGDALLTEYYRFRFRPKKAQNENE